LPADLEVIDIPSAELHVTSSLAHTDLYVRVSDVAPSGTITHVSDALRRLAADQPIDGMVEVELAPVAHRFQRGHRIRVQVPARRIRAGTVTSAPASPPLPRARCARPISRFITPPIGLPSSSSAPG
jgi:predicted acyl esterase